MASCRTKPLLPSAYCPTTWSLTDHCCHPAELRLAAPTAVPTPGGWLAQVMLPDGQASLVGSPRCALMVRPETGSVAYALRVAARDAQVPGRGGRSNRMQVRRSPPPLERTWSAVLF